MPIGVIVVAAGRGERLGGGVPKQLLDLGGRSILERSVAVFDAVPDVATVVVVLPADLVSSGASLVGSRRHACQFVAGGARRQDSVRNGLAAVPKDVELVLVHDAARPFADSDLITRVIEGARRSGASVPAVPARDTVKRARVGERLVQETIAREEIWLAQTPQGFRRDVIETAVGLGENTIPATDEAMLAERAGYSVEIVRGDERNGKITTADDLIAARAAVAASPRVGSGYDLHRLTQGRALVLAGVVVPFERGPLGHSDGDVVCHALVDALLGAAAAGDIGQHFPPTDARWKDAPGLDLLARAVSVVREQGWAPSSVDVTVVLERPKLAPHAGAIREKLARVLGLDVGAVSVKAKTNEGVDAVGRGEAIAAHAVAVLLPGTRS